MSQLKMGAMLSYVNIFITNIIGLLLTPFMISRLGDSEYGLYLLIGSVITYLSVMDLGLNNSLIRYISLYRAENKKNKIVEIINTLFLMYLFICLIVLILGIIGYFKFSDVFSESLNDYEIALGKKMYLVLLLNLIITLPGGIFTALCNAYENFVFPKTLQIIKNVIRAVFITFALYKNKGALSIVIIDTILNLSFIVVTMYYTITNLQIKYYISFKPNLYLMKEIFSYSIWIFLSLIATQFQWNAGQTIIGIYKDTITIAIYGVGILLGGYYGAFAGVINTLLLPKATKLFVEKKTGYDYTTEMIRFARINVFILFLVLGGFILLGKSFIVLWLSNVYLDSWLIALLIMIVMTLPLVQAFGNSILEAHLKNKFRSILNLSTLSIALVSAFYLAKQIGIFGVLFPILIAIVINSIGLSIYFKKIFQFQIIRFLKEVFIKPILVNSVLVICLHFIIINISISSWVHLFISIVVFSILYLFFNYFIVMNKDEKKIIKL